MEECKVVEILKEPKRDYLRLDHTTINFWFVAVVMRTKSGEHESTVTFESLEDAKKLKLGDVFWR